MEAEIKPTLQLGERMKMYEEESLKVTKIDPFQPFIIRLDGRSFSKFTSGMKKPFDMNFLNAMVLTTIDIINEFSAVTGYTHSDEITIIFKQAISPEEQQKLDKKATHIFDGRVNKLLTVMSGFCSVRFNFHLIKLMNNAKSHYQDIYLNEINEMNAHFDARLVLFPEDNIGEIVNHMIWRSIFDCERNAVSTYARFYYSQKELNGKSKVEMKEMLKLKGLDWENDVNFALKHGVYLKKDTYVVKDLMKDDAVVTRTKVSCKCFKIKYNDFFIRILNEKLWNVSDDEALENEVKFFDLEENMK